MLKIFIFSLLKSIENSVNTYWFFELWIIISFVSFCSGVQCAAVNVICELARKNPRNYLALAPLFFKLMTTSSNNWMLIKIIKLVCFLYLQIIYFFDSAIPYVTKIVREISLIRTSIIEKWKIVKGRFQIPPEPIFHKVD